MTKLKTGPVRDYESTAKTISRKISSKNLYKCRKSKLKCACEQKSTSKKLKFGFKKKLGLKWTMNRSGKSLRKKIRSKKSKKAKIKVKLQHVNKNPLARKRNFVQTPCSHSTLKLELKNFTPQNHSLFRSTFLFRRDQNHCFNLTSKIIKMSEQILKKDSAPLHFKFFEL